MLGRLITHLVVIFDAHAERVDEDGAQQSLLEVFVLDESFDGPLEDLVVLFDERPTQRCWRTSPAGSNGFHRLIVAFFFFFFFVIFAVVFAHLFRFARLGIVRFATATTVVVRLHVDGRFGRVLPIVALDPVVIAVASSSCQTKK